MKDRSRAVPARIRQAEDPDEAFRRRALRDRERIVALARRLEKSAAWSRVAKPLQALEEVAHGLAGAGGTFGFLQVSEAAARVERLAERWRMNPPDTFTSRRAGSLARTIASLEKLLQAVGETG